MTQYRGQRAIFNDKFKPEPKKTSLDDVVKKELKRCRFKDHEKNVQKILFRIKKKLSTESEARKYVHSLIMKNTSSLERC